MLRFLISIVVIIFLYVSSFYLIRHFKPNFVITNDGYKSWYATLMYPIRYIDTYVKDYERIHDGPAEYIDSNIYHEKIFLKRSFIFAVYAPTNELQSKFASTSTGSILTLKFNRTLESNENFKDYFTLSIKSAE
jgi:hypothetical protein